MSIGPAKKDKAASRVTKAAKAAKNAGTVEVIISMTVTPYTKRGDIEYSDDAQLLAVHAFLDELYPEFELRRADSQVLLFVVSCERGEENGHPHGQGVYKLVIGEASLDALLRNEKAWLRARWAHATALPNPRIELRIVREQDLMYLVGYCLKDEGLPHFRSVSGGIDADMRARAKELYRANAGAVSFSSKKTNKNPKADEKQLAFKLGNKITLAVWFVHHHELDPLRDVLTLPLIMAFAIETTKYRLDDEVISGKYGGAPLDAARTNAMLQLSFLASAAPRPRTTVPLIETVLFGAEQHQPRDNGVSMGAGLRAVPSTQELVGYSLAEAKALAALLRSEGPRPTARADAVDVHAHGGRFIILDFLSCAASAEIADLLERTGLTRSTVFAFSQLPSACGYLAVAWVCLLHQLGGAAFDTLDLATASAFNTVAWLTEANVHLDLEPAAGDGTAEWLTGDQIIALAAAVNPDGAGTAPAWLSGPAPLNYLRTMLARTLATASEHGSLHLAVVNNKNAYSLTETFSGEHWFVVGWWLDAAPTAAA